MPLNRSDHYHDLDLHANQLLNSRVHNITTANRVILGGTLGLSDKGYQVYDTNLSTPYFWDGVAWQSVGGSYVPLSRNITINGTTYDLSADRTWTVSGLPSQSGHAGEWLKTDGTNASWASLPSPTIPDLQQVLTAGRTEVNGAVYSITLNEFYNLGDDNYVFKSYNIDKPEIQAVLSIGYSNNYLTIGDPTLQYSIGYVDIRPNAITLANSNNNQYKNIIASPINYSSDYTNTLPKANGVFALSINNTYTADEFGNISIPIGTGTVTQIDTSGPIIGGTITTTGTIGISQATTSTDGYLSSTDWNTFNNKLGSVPNLQDVTDVGYTTTNSISVHTLNLTSPMFGDMNLSQTDDDGSFLVKDKNGSELIKATPEFGGTFASLKIGYSGSSGGSFTLINNSSNNEIFTLPNASGTIPLTVNGQSADSAGAITIPIGTGTVTQVTATSPLSSTGGATPDISIQQASASQGGYVSSTDWSTFNGKEPAITAGTTSQYWRGDKTWQTFPTIPTVGTWGALNYPTWSTGTPFVKMNAVGSFTLDTTSYQPLLTNPVTGTGTSTRIAFWDSSSSIASDADLYWDNGLKRLGVGTTSPLYKLHIGTLSNNGDIGIVGNNPQLNFSIPGNSLWRIESPIAGDFQISAVGNTNAAIEISKTNKVLINGVIGTTTTYNLDINGTFHTVGQNRLDDLAGTGTRMVVANTNGDLSTQTIPSFTSPLIAKGDIYVRNGSGDTRLGVGIDTQVLIADSSTATGLKWGSNTAPTPTGYYGAFSDVTSQTAAAINTGYPMLLGVTDLSNGVTVVSGSRVTIANTGIYNIQWSAQFTNPTSSEHDVTIWLRKNGVDVPGSSGIVLVPAKHGADDGHTLPSWNFLLDVVGGDYYEFVWSTANTSVYISFNPAGSPPPSTASVVLTVTQQSGIMAGTGITAINSLTGAVQTLGTGSSGTDFAITSSGTSHTFNLPTASSTNRGALSSADWTTFNNKVGNSDTDYEYLMMSGFRNTYNY